MIITLEDGKTFNSETDLTAPERHILQKLLFWCSMADSMEVFQDKKREALRKGWNNSGPISESPNLRQILFDLEKRMLKRLR